jgi:hypothetical protein
MTNPTPQGNTPLQGANNEQPQQAAPAYSAPAQPQQAPQTAPAYGAPQYQQAPAQPQYAQPAYQPVPVNDSGSIGWGVLGFFIPLVGLILFLVWKDTKPKSAKAAGIGALISVGVGVLFYIIIAIIGVVAFSANTAVITLL